MIVIVNGLIFFPRLLPRQTRQHRGRKDELQRWSSRTGSGGTYYAVIRKLHLLKQTSRFLWFISSTTTNAFAEWKWNNKPGARGCSIAFLDLGSTGSSLRRFPCFVLHALHCKLTLLRYKSTLLPIALTFFASQIRPFIESNFLSASYSDKNKIPCKYVQYVKYASIFKYPTR